MIETDRADRQTAPVAKTDRIDSLDILRGVAVFGILLMNISAFGLVWQAYGNPYAAGGADPLNVRLFEIMNVGFEGTMRGIFSMLFGAGIVLMTERNEAAGAGLMTAEIHFRRMSWLMLFGVVHWALLLWTGEILFAYSLCGFALFAVRKIAARWQLAIGIAILIVSAVYFNFKAGETADLSQQASVAQAVVDGGGKPSEEQQATLAQWSERVAETKPSEQSNAMFKGWHDGSYWNAVSGQFDFSYEFQWAHAPTWLLLDAIPFMLLGMALLKFGVLSARRTARFYAAMMLAGYAIGIPLGLYELSILHAGDFGPVAAAEAGRTYEFSRLAMVCGHLGLVLLAVKLGVAKWLQKGFAAAGQMALSNYIGQTLICTTLFYSFGIGLGLYGDFQRSQLYLIVLTIAVVEMIFSVIWLKNFRFGPLEWLWRSLTYWKPQPMRLRSGGGSAPPTGQVLGAA